MNNAQVQAVGTKSSLAVNELEEKQKTNVGYNGEMKATNVVGGDRRNSLDGHCFVPRHLQQDANASIHTISKISYLHK
jgi:hypothetical protein